MQREIEEPVFSNQEQAIVYLFSRYWQKMDEFKRGTITRIHTHFPDCWIETIEGKKEAIEFEYDLHAVRSHLRHRRKDLRKLHGHDIKCLHVVYWERNDDERDLAKEIRKAGIRAEFVCLKDRFRARVGPRKDGPLRPSWVFTQKAAKKAYPITELQRRVDALARQGSVIRLNVSKREQIYRIIGFDKSGSDFIEWDHWEKIHFFTTTTRFSREQIPNRLFVKPQGCKHFVGYFDVKEAFEVNDSISAPPQLRQLFRKHYFYEYNHGESKCFVCSFKQLDYERGIKLYNYLQNSECVLGVQSSVLIDRKHHARLNRIISG